MQQAQTPVIEECGDGYEAPRVGRFGDPG